MNMASRKLRNIASSLNAAKLIDEEFARPITITIAGKKDRVSTFFAIFYQLASRAPKDRRALQVMSRYIAYAKSKGGLGSIKIEFAPE
jgi:hypothetical protein